MKRKRLARDIMSWDFGDSPYYQFRLDHEDFHGLAGVLKLTDVAFQYWTSPKAGTYPVCGHGMCWFQLVPDGQSRVITVMLKPESKIAGGISYPYSISAWYVDVIDALEYDDDGVAVFLDKYLDVIVTPQGDVKVDDRDELDAAYESGELSEEQYRSALREGDAILTELCADIPASEELYMKLFAAAERLTRSMQPTPKKNRPIERVAH